MTPELILTSRIAILSLLVIALEYLATTRPQLMEDIAFELRFALMVPLVFALCVVIWLFGALYIERHKYPEVGVGRLRA